MPTPTSLAGKKIKWQEKIGPIISLKDTHLLSLYVHQSQRPCLIRMTVPRKRVKQEMLSFETPYRSSSDEKKKIDE